MDCLISRIRILHITKCWIYSKTAPRRINVGENKHFNAVSASIHNVETPSDFNVEKCTYIYNIRFQRWSNVRFQRLFILTKSNVFNVEVWRCFNFFFFFFCLLGWVFVSCKVSSFSVQRLQRSLKFTSQSEARAANLFFRLARKNINLLEDNKYLLCRKLRQIPFNGCRGVVNSVSANQRQGRQWATLSGTKVRTIMSDFTWN